MFKVFKKSTFSGKLTPVLMVLFVGLLLYGKLLLGQMLFATDILAYQLPEKYFISECLRSGIIPFLNPYILCGTEFYANMDVGILNPLNIVLLIGNQMVGYNLFVLAHYLLAMLSMYLLLNCAYRLNVWICMIGGIAYGEGYPWSMSGNGFFRCAFLVPLFLLFYLKYLEYSNAGLAKKKHNAFIASVIILSLLFYSGNFLEAYFTVIFAGAMGLYFSFLLYSGDEVKKALNVLKGSIIILILSIMIASPVLIPVISTSLTSYRSQGIPIVEAQQWSFPPLRLIEYIAPFFFGARQNDGIWYEGIYKVEETFSKTGLSPWADCIYVGIPVILGFLLLIRFKKEWRDKFIICSLVFAFVLALGKFTPAYKCLYYLLPGFKMFRHPEKFLFWVNLWLIIAGCSGLQLLLMEKEKALNFMFKLLKLSTMTLTFIALFFFCLFVFYQDFMIKYIQAKGSMMNGDEIFLWEIFTICLSLAVFLALFVSVKFLKSSPERILIAFFVVTILNFTVWQYRIDWTIPEGDFNKVHTWDEKLPAFDVRKWRIFSTGKFIYPVTLSTPKPDSFKIRKLMEYSTLDCNTPVLKKIRTVSGFTPVMNKEYVKYMNFDRHDPERVLDLLSVRFVAIHNVPENVLPVGTRIIFRDEIGEFVILENTDALPRITTYSEFVQADKEKMDEIVFDVKRDIHRNFVLCELPANFNKEISCSKDSSVEIIEENPNQVTLKVENGPCWLVLRDWYNAGWSCFEGGRKIPIIKADGGLMAVFISSENSTLQFRYFPPGLKVGLILMAIGSAVLLGYVFMAFLNQSGKTD
ncbi:MAG: YfhO family protein [Victivallales bacterium]